MRRFFIGVITFGGSAGGGYGGTYTREIEFASAHRAGSRANADDCITEYRRRYGRAGWIEVESVRLDREAIHG